jgi:hypothetical protein
MSKKELIIFRYGDRNLPSVTEQLSITLWAIIGKWNIILPNEYVVLITASNWYYPADMEDDRAEYQAEIVRWLDENNIWWDKMRNINRVGHTSVLSFLLDNEADAARFKLAFS